MLKFFRRIRKRLLESGKIKSYSFYAIGEIVLVVIGILIALQINNWNQTRQNKKLEQPLLINLKEALVTDLENTIQDNKTICEQRQLITSMLIKAAEMGLMLPDSLTPYYVTMGLRLKFRPAMTAYKVLQSEGLDIIRDEKLKFRIIDLYDMEYQLIMDRLENEDFNLRDIYRPQIRKHFDYNLPTPSSPLLAYYPTSYPSMIKDRDFINTISIMNINSRSDLKLLEEQSNNIQDLIDQIDIQLEEKESG